MDVDLNNQELVTLSDSNTHTNLLKFKYNNDLDKQGKLYRLSTELTKKTEFDVIHFKDEATKVKKKYMQLNIVFSKKSAGDLEQKGMKKITRKRLPPRPRVTVGSDAEGAWARKCIAILEAYEKELKTVKRKLIKADRERLARYRKIIGA
ncbi:hypothetical protein [Photobacterium leiognathi]|uniref:hypothetical protein n=1 Tax=Photobacterium leiognathi TaxID=553611 RepID=UPI00298244B4|nr:hypothetical protein [Photobacterium leiognathi]